MLDNGQHANTHERHTNPFESASALAQHTAPTYFDLIGGAVDAQLLKIIIEEVVSPLSIGAVLTS